MTNGKLAEFLSFGIKYLSYLCQHFRCIHTFWAFSLRKIVWFEKLQDRMYIHPTGFSVNVSVLNQNM